jgi:MFS family permease
MLQSIQQKRDFSSSLDPSRHISILALSSTVSRLASGLVSDYISSPTRAHPVSRIPLFVALALVHVSGLLVLSYAPVSWLREWFSLGSVLVGIGYGGIFTLAPTVVSVVWGIGGFGRNWGILTFTPGSFLSADRADNQHWEQLFLA